MYPAASKVGLFLGPAPPQLVGRCKFMYQEMFAKDILGNCDSATHWVMGACLQRRLCSAMLWGLGLLCKC